MADANTQPVHIKNGSNYSGYNFSNIENISGLSTKTTLSDNDVLLLNTNSADAKKITGANLIQRCECLIVSTGTVSALPVTISNAAIETDMICIHSTLSNPAAQTGDWTVNTDTAGQVTISGNINGSTTITLYLMKGREA